MDRFSVTPISENGRAEKKQSFRNEIILNVGDYVKKNVQTVTATPAAALQDSAPANNDQRKQSLAQLTREALPRLDNYRISKRALKRPSMGELHGDPDKKAIVDDGDDSPTHTSHIQLGWIQGVLIPCLLNIWGVMLFLRLAWVVAQSGIAQTFVIIGISYLVCFITTLSMSAICTNGDVKGGGIYYIISRSLGPEFGASVGIVFAFANAVAASMNTIGFCDSLNGLLKSYDVKIIDGGVNDTRIVGTIMIFLMIVICAVGMDWEAQAQNFLLVAILAAIACFIGGVIMGPKSEDEVAQGFVGISSQVFKENWKPNYRFSENLDQSFFTVFAIFFPSVTGIQAGANICGDLKDPASAIPKGTLWALLISGLSYVFFVFFAGTAALRDASGNLTEMIMQEHGNYTCALTNSCEFGLQNSYSIMQLMAAWSPLIYLGCWAATLSTALTNLLSVPKLIQALGTDRIYPGLIFFSKGYGKHNEPLRGYALTFVVSTAFLLIADLNLIAPLISTFYLVSYALINFCTFHAALVKPLGWRPTFKYFNIWVSLFGAVLCVGIMFLIDWFSAVITLAILFSLYLLVLYRKPDVNWGSSTQAQTYKTALASALQLQNVNEHVKNYSPQILVLAGKPYHRPPLVDFANLITKNNSLMIIGDVVQERISHRRRKAMIEEAYQWIQANKIKAFYNLIDGVSFQDGIRALVQASGFGKLTPNIVLLGYKPDWRSCNPKELMEYFNILHNFFDNRMSVAILRLPNGIDYSHLVPELFGHSNKGMDAEFNSSNNLDSYNQMTTKRRPTLLPSDSNLNIAAMDFSSSDPNLTFAAQSPLERMRLEKARVQLQHLNYFTQNGSGVPKEVMETMNVFNKKQKKGTIDVWWLYDDGGLTMLLPYIISTRSNYANCDIRVFALANRKLELETEEQSMAKLLNKLRIEYSSLIMVQGISEQPEGSTIAMHQQLLEGFMEDERDDECSVLHTELAALQAKTNRQLRLRELLIEHSVQANMVIMSLPMPRQGTVSAPLYMSWLEMLTRDMPPMLLVRGNQTSVLTFYS